MNNMSGKAGGTAGGAPQTKLVLATVMLAYMGQMMLNPIIAPLSRAMGMAEWQIGATISLAAIALAASSQFWGRRSQKLGVKKVLVVSMTIAACALAGFAAIAWLGVKGVWVGPSMVVGVILTRGALYGSAISAVSPTAQAYLVTLTETEDERVKAVGAVGAVQGISVVVGAVVGGSLAAAGGLLLPLSVVPFVMALAVVVLGLRFAPQQRTELVAEPAHISYFDPRVLPFLIAGFIMFLGFSSMQSVIGFAVQDRFGLDESATAGVTAALMVVMSVSMVVTQAGVVPRLRWEARRLLRIGLFLTTVGFALFLPSASYALLFGGSFLAGVGMGMAMPGYNAGPTMSMKPEEQGGLAGLINANNGMTYAIAPILSTSLYGWNPAIPFVGVVIIMAAAALFSCLHPHLRLRRGANQPSTCAR